MDSTIQMGNDEFILYIRKQHPKCSIRNERLGRKIWEWLHKNCSATQVVIGKPCYWGISGSFINELQLPAHATQFEFKREYLPQLYTYLDELGRE